MVELDTSYHYLPKEKDVRNWLTQVPDNFRFILKVHQSVTTQGDLPEGMSMAEALTAFKQAIQPMVDAGRLYCLLAQFPNRFKCTKESVAYLDEVRQWFAAYPVAIELRIIVGISQSSALRCKPICASKSSRWLLLMSPRNFHYGSF